MFHTNFDDNPYGIEWLRFQPESSLPELVKTAPHIAFKVDNLEEAIAGKEILIEPNSPSAGVKVAFIVHNGAPIEFLEYDESAQVTDFPELETSRLHLRQIRSDDAPAMLKLRSDPQVMQYLDRDPFQTERQAHDLIQMISRDYLEGQSVNWAVTLKEDKQSQMVGYCGLINYLKNHFRAEVGYLLAPSLWGKGIMKETLRAVLEYGFDKMQLHSVEAQLNPGNKASIALLAKFNFRREAYFKEAYYYNGVFIDSAVYSLLRNNFS